ncbi:MAG: hypothetical protein ABI882_18685 [Acidobacteriota bacterium]
MSGAQTCFESYGIHVAISVDDAGLLPSIEQHFPPGFSRFTDREPDRTYLIESSPAGEPTEISYRLSVEGGQLTRSTNLESVLDSFESDSRIFIGEMTTDRVFLHAGVVNWRGRAIVIPGRSWTGKSTLVATLVRAGAAYLSDEYAVLDRLGQVHPYLKPLALRDSSGIQTNHTVEALGGIAMTQSMRVGLVLKCEYQKDAVWKPERLAPSEGAMVLADNSLSIRRQPGLVLEVLRRVTANTDILGGHRGEAHQVVDYLLENYPVWESDD